MAGAAPSAQLVSGLATVALGHGETRVGRETLGPDFSFVSRQQAIIRVAEDGAVSLESIGTNATGILSAGTTWDRRDSNLRASGRHDPARVSAVAGSTAGSAKAPR
jgi:hypothetical protein